MIKLSKKYKKLLIKHSPNEILNMYRDNKMELNPKEWQDLHRRIDKENQIYYKWELKTVISFIICLIILITSSFYLDTSNFEKIKQCNDKLGHTCSRYEIEKMYGNE